MSRRIFGIPSRVILIAVVAIVAFAVFFLVLSNFQSIFDWVDGALRFVFNPAERIDPDTIIKCSDSPGCRGLHPIIFGIVFTLVIVTGFAYTTLLERKVISWIQHRVGPNRVGPWGLLQPLADAIKLIFKEDIFPAGASKWVYLISPMLKAIPVIIVVAVIPLGPPITIPWFDGNWYQIPMGMADPNVGVLWILAITSLGTYGVVLSGWASNNKYSMLGGLRASAQMISYELSMGMAMAVPVLIAGSMSVGDIINQQKTILDWYVFQNPLAAAILMIALLAEVNRSPFDLPEAEQELTQGYMTEYSGMKFAMFMMAEYIGMIAVSMIAVALYFGGYHLIPVDTIPLAGPLNFILKVVLMLAGMVWVRGTLPRIRYDRLMMFGWKVMLPLSILAVAWTSIAIVIGDVTGGDATIYGLISGIVFVLVLAGGYAIFRQAGEEDAPVQEPELADDPAITGERNSLGYGLIMVLGGILAIPFAIVDWTIKALDGLKAAGDSPSDETAIAIVDENQPSTPAKSGGD